LLLKKLHVENYFIALLILVGITLLTVVSTFLITAFLPGSVGREPGQYEIISINQFEPWSFEAGELTALYPEGGVIATIGETDFERTVILLGDALYEQNGRSQDFDTAGGILMVIDHPLFEEIRGDNIFIPVEDRETADRISGIFDKQIVVPVLWEVYIPLTFHAREGLAYYYFISPEGDPILPPATDYKFGGFYASFLLYALYTIIMLLIITIFSLDHRYSRYWIHLRKTNPGLLSLALIPLIVAVITVSELAPVLNHWPGIYSAAGYLLVITVLILLAKRGKIDYLDFGMRRDRLKNGYMMAVIAALLITFTVGDLQFSVNLSSYRPVFYLPLIFLLVGLPREMLWRGYIQAFLSRRMGPNGGMLVMILLAAVSHYIVIVAAEPWMAFYPYTYLEAAVLVPGTAAILGYLYLRTENILSCALLHSLILWLPGIIFN
jgi:membrane protease YdiL (CAAX protease family)